MLNFSVDSKEVERVSISKSKKGFNYASVTSKVGDGVYVNLSIEWEGEDLPDLVMDMASMLASKEKASLDESNEEAIAFEDRLSKNLKK